MKVLVTGGAGYIGSTICSALEDRGHTPVILDSLVNGRIEFTKNRIFYKGDIADLSLVEKIMTEHPEIRTCVHCAALTVVPESVADPYSYYNENVAKTNTLLKKLCELGCKDFLFSSSASVYGDTKKQAVTENDPLNPQSPYAATKYMCELIMRDFSVAYGARAIVFRYFNVVGADPSMRTGPYKDAPTLLLPRLILHDKGLDTFKLTGINWPTRDGTGVRDYVHVWDIAMAHALAVERFDTVCAESPFQAINLGTGSGVTVREFISDFEAVVGHKLTIEETDPRPGDVAGAYTKIDKAKNLLGWAPTLSIQSAISDNLKWYDIYNSGKFANK